MSEIITAEVCEVQFGLYSDHAVKNELGICRITVPATLDADGNQVPNGLYDTRLGPVDSRGKHCGTCNLNYFHCPGHCGYIELEVMMIMMIIMIMISNDK